jgi:hypothetical protein
MTIEARLSYPKNLKKVLQLFYTKCDGLRVAERIYAYNTQEYARYAKIRSDVDEIR